MQFGVCGNMDINALAAEAAFDYTEWSVPNLLCPLEPDSGFAESLANIQSAALPYPVSNGFVPGELKITGPDVNPSALENYVQTTMQRAETAGIEIIVFGSGGARRIPEGFDRDKAHDQLVDFCRMTGKHTQDHGVAVAIEPLNLKECNVLNTVDECAALAREVDHPGIRLLADAYHMMQDDDPFDSIVRNKDLLIHVHIATKEHRMAPGGEPCDFRPFFKALSDAEYNGRISIEGKLPKTAQELAKALDVMRQHAE